MNSVLGLTIFVSTILAPLSGASHTKSEKVFEGSFKVEYKSGRQIKLLSQSQIKFLAGEEGSLVIHDPQYEVALTVRVQDSKQGKTALITSLIKENNKLVSSPQMLVRLGKTGSCQIGSKDRFVRLEALVK